MRVSLLVVVVPLSLFLTACEPKSEMDASGSRASSGPLRRLNPAPKQGYRIRLTIQDAPGPLVLVGATAQYDVINEIQCGEASPSGGAYRVTSNEVLVLERLDKMTYEGIVYIDQILDGDYYGKGLCKWEFSEVRAVLNATGRVEETRFSPHLSAESVRGGVSERRHFWKGMYPKSEVESFPDFGEADRNKMNRRDHELFTLTLVAKEIEP